MQKIRHQRPIRRVTLVFASISLFAILAPSLLGAQALTLPPSGENQVASVTQWIGPVEITIDYSSPDVTGPQGQDRRGQIWGALVPWGLNNLGFGTSTAAPWRAGSNQNTTITVSHDLEIQGKPLPAGTYGFHVIPEESGPWTLIFSNNSTAWGSFFYDPAEDALRVEATPEPAPFREWLTYEFLDRQPTEATVALHWEELRLPFTFSVPNRDEVYLTTIRKELQNSPGFNWQNWVAAVNFALTTNQVTDETLTWANNAVSLPFVGQENFNTLVALGRVQAALGNGDEATQTMKRAAAHPTSSPLQVHTLARQMQAQGATEGATALFKLNAELNGESWPMSVGLARAHSAEGNFKEALRYAKMALEQAPDPNNRSNLETIIGILEQGKDFNISN